MISPIRPMEPVLLSDIRPSDAHLYQVKWDGVRILTYRTEDTVRLFNRKQRERSDRYPELCTEATGLSCRSAVLDGEVIALENGKPNFFRVLKRDLATSPQRKRTVQQTIPVYYMVFDLLYLDGQWLVDEPLHRRLGLLQALLPSVPGARIQLCESFDDGPGLWEATRQQGLEGVVMKEREGRYHVGRKHPTWLKVKHFREMEVTAVGVFLRGGRVHSLLMGIRQDDDWVYIGRVGSGLDEEERRLLTEWFPRVRRKEPTVINPPADNREHVEWIEPLLRLKVQYLEWTPEGTLRSPSLLGFGPTP